MTLRELLRGLSERKDGYLLVHQAGVCFYADMLVQEVAPRLRPVVLTAAAYHDVGKALLPDNLLFKDGDLTPEEWKYVRLHPVSGADLLKRGILGEAWQNGSWEQVVLAVRHHHERWDGSGYPDGIKEEKIPLAARIIALADAYDAMTTDRPYRRALSRETALKRIVESAGTQFDPNLAQIFVKTLSSLEDRNLRDQLADFSAKFSYPDLGRWAASG
ncbi:HD domain-containing protein [Thermanaeromonas toyohensis ToBE]|uniref:HD domain-containing protein n=1 Tax=Thermanaeromonas toyohensis ToBE TaxID=698762 RepID=A0A1W1VTG4_9FIRM|nr:HD-GYP domain-containing protein [Thermanaeromonas toyohensis]SMB96662.1 HD domain-containing protein [Thermanaeromonas toyohensis ToBE]